MTLRLEAMIERWPSQHLLFVRELPGFSVSGRDASELHVRSGDALQAHLDWLVERDLIDAPSGEVDLSVVEEAEAISANAGPRFVADLAHPSDDEIEAALAVGRAALSDLIDAADQTDESACSALRHVASMDRWYASRLNDLLVSGGQRGDEIDDLISAAGAFEDTVDEFAQRETPSLFTRDGEEWTLAKVLRRRTAHLREHLIDVLPR